MHNYSSYSFCDSERGDSDVNLVCLLWLWRWTIVQHAFACCTIREFLFRDFFSVYSLRFKTSNRVLRGGADEENTTRRCCREEDLRPKIFTTRQLCVEERYAWKDFRNALRSSSIRAVSCAPQNTDVFEMLASIVLMHSVEKQLH